MLPIYFAPLQGYTDYPFRRLHYAEAGGVTEYTTPFVRWEHGVVRNKDCRDVHPDNNAGVPVVPQVIAANVEELARLCDWLLTLGWHRIDINMGCPFPLQTGAGRGSGLLPHPDRVAAMMELVKSIPEVSFSIKMRLGLGNKKDSHKPANGDSEALMLMPILNEAPLRHLTIHPRWGCQQYKGGPDIDAFLQCYEACQHPLIFNGDIMSTDQIAHLERLFPRLHGVMIGRGLLARPSLAAEYVSGIPMSESQRIALSLSLHSHLLAHSRTTLEGNCQILNRLRAFWEYQEPLLPHKTFKLIMKSGSLPRYLNAVATLRPLAQ